MKSSIITILALTLAALTGFPAAVAAPLPSADDTLLAWLAPFAVQPQHRSAAVGTDPLLSVAQFYHAVGYRPVWTGVDGMLPQGESLMQVMAGAPEAGLFAEAYDPFLDAGQGAGTVLFSGMPFLPRLSAHARLDVMLTEALLRMVGSLSSGRIAPEALYGQWLAWRRPPRENLAVALARAVNEGRLVEFVESLHPRSRDYMALRKSLAQYRRIAQDGGWPTVAPGATLKPGDAGPRVEALRRRLAATDDAKGVLSAAPAETGFDGVLEAAVRRFQHRHGLHVDGLVGQRTLDELNVPVEARITALKLNMERRRWLPDDLGDRHLLANIPDFTLCIVARGKTIDRMRAVVGREDRQTPVMSGRITYLEFNPYWNIPQKIAREDILPNAVRDPGYFSRQGIRVYDTWDARATELDPSGIAWEAFSNRYFPYRLRQDPSRFNALGRVKFMFPNAHSIYIHDTPAKSLFDRRERIFSSGCVRVETPMALALHLLRGQGWDHDRLQGVVARGRPRSVLLEAPLPVHLVYFTAWVDDDGLVNFRQDVYGRDRTLLAALTRRAPSPLQCTRDLPTARAPGTCLAAPDHYISTADTPLLEPAVAAVEGPTAGL